MALSLQTAISHVDDLLARLQNPSSDLYTSNQGTAAAAAAAAAAPKPPAEAAAPARPTKKKAGKAAPAPAAAAAEPATGEVFYKAQLVVGRVAAVGDHPSGSEKLYLLKVDIGGGQPQRQVVAGLKKHVSKEALEGRAVAVVLNLKPAKLAGELSEAMILAAAAPAAPDAGPDAPETVVLLSPPVGSEPGEVISLGGTAPLGEYPKALKSDVWRKVAAELAVGAGGAAAWSGRPLLTERGAVTAEGMPAGAAIR